jgi:hypothetical protein
MTDPKPNQTSEMMVESVNAARSSKAGKVLGAHKLKSGDIIVTANIHETQYLIEQENSWRKVIAVRTKVKGQ